MPQHPGPLGWIEPADRTNEQRAAHDDALAVMSAVRFAPVPRYPAPGQKIILADACKNADVVADVGFQFDGFHQLTGSCVGASGGNAMFLLGAIQRQLATNPTAAFVPFWPHAYGLSRAAAGMRGQGEGSVDSVIGQIFTKRGQLGAAVPGLPQFVRGDGLVLTEKLEFAWSDGNSALVTGFNGQASPHLLGSAAPIYDTLAMSGAIMDGYPILTGCGYYVGGGEIVHGNDPAKAYVRGRYTGRGGHSTGRMAVWNHPDDGVLIGYWNQWPRSTYPSDPAGLPRCAVWVPVAEEERMLKSLGGGDGETMAMSHLDWFPAQPKVEETYSQYV